MFLEGDFGGERTFRVKGKKKIPWLIGDVKGFLDPIIFLACA
jgi:hypothetical protein